MLATRYRLLRIVAGLIIFLLGCPPANDPPRDVIIQGINNIGQAGLTILGEIFILAPESTGSFLLQVRDPDTGALIDNGVVTVTLADPDGDSTQLFRGNTNEQGMVEVSFTVPEKVTNPNQVLVIESSSKVGKSKYEENVFVGRAFNILVSTDKPVYQPGQTIHIRALALDTLAMAAAQNHELILTVADPNGNKVARQSLVTSDFGIASTDFVLDALAASGDYNISAEIGPIISTRSVEVKPYTLPKFKVEFSSDKNFYLPGETATGEINANYFFGKPVSGGQVTIRGFVNDVGRTQVLEQSGVTDDNGKFAYSFEVPDYFVGQLDNNAAEVELEISVVDTANHVENTDEKITIAEKPILLEAIPESGILRSGIENIVYIDATFPDGRPAPSIIQVASPLLTEPVTLATDEYGLTSFRISPSITATAELSLTATTTPTSAASRAETVTQRLTLDADQTATSLLLRPERAEYAIGDTMNLDIHLAGHPSTVYLDVIKGRQSFALVSLPVVDNLAQASIDIDGSLLGTLELNAYVITDQGEIVRDRRLVLVNPAPAEVTIDTDETTYRPGDNAILDLHLTRDGKPMAGALGISIVDESVFSVGAQDPGFARTYFLLERELLEPRYEIHGFSDLSDEDESPYDDKSESAHVGAIVPSSNSEQSTAASIASQNTALMGLFAHELKILNAPTLPSPVGANQHQAWQWAWLNRLGLIVPLAGLALYNGTKSRRRLLIATVLFALAATFYAACSGGSPVAPAASQGPEPITETTATRGTSESTRLRQYFPETLYWVPELETDKSGHAQVELPVADSITSWRISVVASDAAGNLGSGQASMQVFQDFFVEPDLPRFLTVGDEIDIPVAIYNYLDTPQTVDLTVKEASWFELRDDSIQSLQLEPNEVRAAYVPIRVLEFGSQDFEISAASDSASDAILRTVEVSPNGRPQASAVNGQLEAAHSFAVSVPKNAILGTGRVTVKLYPGIVSQAIDGLAGMLHEPYGCFEQTSSVNYPNLLVLDYLRTTNQRSPSIELRAENFINAGYQRLMTFEVPGSPGGFSLFGSPPPETMLTAYGLMQFADMSRVRYVDPDLLDRTRQFLADRQMVDGSWRPEGMHIDIPDDSENGDRLGATAYIVWALAEAGFGEQPEVTNGLAYLDENLNVDQADSYLLALAANAYAAAEQPSKDLLDELSDRPISDSGDSLRWSSSATTWLGGYGSIVDLETTSMVALAFLRSNVHLDQAEQAIAYISNQRTYAGDFGTTQATIMALKALLQAAQMGGEGGTSTVTISLGGSRDNVITIDDSNSDVVQTVSFDDIGNEPVDLMISKDGDRAVQYQVVTEYYQAWPGPTSTPATTPAPQGVRIDVAYDRTELAVNDVVQVHAEVEVLSKGVAGTLLVDIGIPPGFSPLTVDLDDLVSSGLISRYELTGRQIIFYMTNVPSGEPFNLPYRLQARYPIRALTPASSAYDYYTPEQRATEAPQRIVVTLGTPK